MMSIYKDIIKLIEKGMTVEAQEKVMDLREHVLSLQEENQELKTELGKLKEQSAIQETLVWEKPVYWTEKDGKRDGPYCQKCWDAEKTLVRVHHYSDGGSPEIYKCYKCEISFPHS